MTKKQTDVPIAVQKAQELRWQRRREEADRKRTEASAMIVEKLCKKLSAMKTLEAMQNFVDTFIDERANAICDTILSAKTLEEAREILVSYTEKPPITVVVQHCIDNTTGRQINVFRIKEVGLAAICEVRHANYLQGVFAIEASARIHKARLRIGTFTIEKIPPWAPYDKVPPAIQQSMQLAEQRTAGRSWSVAASHQPQPTR